MDIISKIKKSVVAATKLPFYYDTPQTLNIRLDNARFPCAMLNIVESGAVADTNGVLHERLTINMLFVNLCELDFDGEDIERSTIDELKRYGLGWAASLYRSRDLRVVSLNGTSRYYATNDAICAAFGVNITIEEIDGFSACDLPE